MCPANLKVFRVITIHVIWMQHYLQCSHSLVYSIHCCFVRLIERFVGIRDQNNTIEELIPIILKLGHCKLQRSTEGVERRDSESVAKEFICSG